MKIKEFRLKKNMTQAELAKRLGAERSTVSMWEKGSNKPDRDMIKKLSEIFGVSVDDIICEDTEGAIHQKHSCILNANIICMEKKCSVCGWNPAVAAARVKALGERFAKYGGSYVRGKEMKK